MGIEPTTLGLKGQVGLSHGMASVRMLSQRLEILGPHDSTRHQDLAGFSFSFAAPLLTVREVAAFLRVSARTV